MLSGQMPAAPQSGAIQAPQAGTPVSGSAPTSNVPWVGAGAAKDPLNPYKPSGGGNFGAYQPAANPAQQRTDANGDIWQYIPAPRGPFGGANTGGQWQKIGNTGANAGGGGAPRTSAPSAPPPPDPNTDIDFNALWSKTQAVPPPPQVPRDPRVQGPGLEDRRKAEGKEFGRAKARVGAIGRGSMKALGNRMAARGISGSGHEAAGEADILSGMGSDLSNVVTEQALSALAREAQISDRDYGGGIQQRGQDYGIDVGNADRTAENQRTRVNLLTSLMGLRARGSRIY